MKLININIDKVLPFFSLRKKLIVAFVLLSSIPLIIFGIVGMYTSLQSMREIALENLSHDIEIYNERVQYFFTTVNDDIFYITHSYSFKNFVNETGGVKLNEDTDSYFLITKQIRDIAESKRIYYQIRYIENELGELFRIQQTDSIFSITPHSKLSGSNFKYYYVLTGKNNKNEVSVTPAEMLNEAGEMVAVISFASQIFNDENHFRGILVADVFAENLFKILESKGHYGNNREIAIVNSEGNYLYHSEKKKNWNSLLARQSENNILERYPKEFTNAIFSGKAGHISNGYDEILAYAPLLVSPFEDGAHYYLFASVNEKFIFEPVNNFIIISLVFIALFFIVSVTLGILATNRIAKPIKELRKGTEIITGGNYSYQFNIRTNDEIEELAAQLNIMASDLARREKQIIDHQKILEDTVHERTSELQNEKEKMQVILDNVPSAFMLIDKECKILTASAAIKKIAGVDPSEIIGKKCTSVFENEWLCSNCFVKNGNGKNELKNFVETLKNENGEETYIEHITVPILINEKMPVVLEILTDVTDRKRNDEHLIKLEKLITIGETTALIAHEFRNSLTSVKMLIQLQKETGISEENIESLNQSLNSINRMEKIVNDLLRFTRSAAPELIPGNVNKAIDEALRFFQPQLRKKNISLKKVLNESLPMIKIDSGLFKEAITNLLLNSYQAVPNDGEICISTDLITQPKQINDYAYVSGINHGKQTEQFKITLPKGAKVIRVEIKDNGEGIPAQNLSKIFDPFFTTKSGGSGLGLAMVKRTINQHGGVIQVASTLKWGTQFTILLPLGDV